jgi:chemotaxis methyl-accepting protein methylase
MAVAVITFAIGLWSVNHHDVEEVLSSSLSNKTTQKSLNPNLHQTTEGTAAQQENRTERQKKAGQSQIQLSHTSAMNRYPDEYSAVQTYFRTEMSGGISDSDGTTMKNKKMLSFGAATGEEAITLASMYFSNSTFTVYGVDLDEGSLETAKTSAAAHSPKLDDGKIIFFNGQDTDEIGVRMTSYPLSAKIANSPWLPPI